MFYHGEVLALAEQASRLPQEVLACHPLIELDLAWWLIVEWRFSEAEQLLHVVRGRIDDASEGTLTATDSRKLKSAGPSPDDA